MTFIDNSFHERLLQKIDQISSIGACCPPIELHYVDNKLKPYLHLVVTQALKDLSNFFTLLRTPLDEAITFEPNIETYLKNTIKDLSKKFFLLYDILDPNKETEEKYVQSENIIKETYDSDEINKFLTFCTHIKYINGTPSPTITTSVKDCSSFTR